MKRIVTLFLFAVMLMASTAAHAYFEQMDITGSSTVDPDGPRTGVYGAFLRTGYSELGVDLLTSGSLFNHSDFTALDSAGRRAWAGPDMASKLNPLDINRSISQSAIFTATGATSWSQVRFGGFSGMRDASSSTSQFYAFLNLPNGRPLVASDYLTGSFGSTIGAADVVTTQWGGNTSSADWTFTQSATDANSFALRMDNFAGGDLGGLIGGNAGVIDLSLWDTNPDHVYSLYLYGFHRVGSTVTLLNGGNSYGELQLSLANGMVNVQAVPVPAAIWVLGSGLLGLLGFRRRFAA
jgi:hypothetical protein